MRRACAAGARGSSAAAGQPSVVARGSARTSPANPKFARTLADEPRILKPSTARAPARNNANNSSAIPAISLRRAVARGSSLEAPSEPDDLSVLADGDNRVRIQLAAREVIPGEAGAGERLPVDRALDLRDVVGIL